MKSLINARYWRGRSLKARVAVAAIAATSIAGASVLGVSAASAKGKSAPLIVWIDTARVPYEKAYMAANPHANVKWVLYNGNENGTGILQSKFALWNRTGWPSDAPDVMFDTQHPCRLLQAHRRPAQPQELRPEERAGQVRRHFDEGRLHDTERPGRLPAQ